LHVAYCYFALLPSQRTDMMQQLASNVPLEFCNRTNEEQANVSETPGASAYEFTESALVDKQVSCHGV